MKKVDNSSKAGIKFFIFTIIITLTSLCFISFYTFSSFYELAKIDAVSIGEKAIYESSEKLNNFLLQGRNVLTVTAETVEYMMKKGSSISEIEDYLKNESKNYSKKITKSFTGIYGYIDGNYVDGDGWRPEKGYDPKTRDWFRGAWWTLGKTTIIPPYIDAQTGKVIISVSKMLYDWSVLAMDIQLDDLENFIKTIDFDGYGFIADRSGLIVAHTDETQIGRNFRNERKYNSYAQTLAKSIFLREPDNTKSDHLIVDGEKSIIFSQQVLDDWFVVMVVSETELYAKVKFNLIRNILLSTIILFVVAYFCTSNFKNRRRASMYAELLKEHQDTLEEQIKLQTEKIKNHTKELFVFQERVIEGIANLIESRDESTGEHVKHTKKYVKMIAEYLYDHNIYPEEVNKTFLDFIGSAATLHDVGKIKIPDEILNKKERFNEDEYNRMKSHTIYGGKIIEDILGQYSDKKLVQFTFNVATFHHEKWDGSGYPFGLSKTAIPLAARIMAVADVYDALISKRVYKEPLTVEDSLKIMKEDSGKAFEPLLLDIFVKLIEEEQKVL